jgi:hypothetical protein
MEPLQANHLAQMYHIECEYLLTAKIAEFFQGFNLFL